MEYGMEYRPYYLAKEWIKMGHNVSIIAAEFSHLRRKNPRVTEDFERREIDGINYYFFKTVKYTHNGGKRALSMCEFSSKLWKAAEKIATVINPQVVVASSTYPLDNYPANRIAKFAKCGKVYEIHDMWPATLIELGGLSPKHPFVKLLQAAEDYGYKNSDAVVSLLPFAKNYMVQHSLEPDRFNYIPNGISVADWQHPDKLPQKHAEVLADLKDKGKLIVCYFGGHALSNALDTILDSAKLVSDPNIVFCLVGDGAEKRRLIERKNNESIDNVIFLPPVPKMSVPNLLKCVDVICICGKGTGLCKFGVGLNKLYDSMMSGTPILLSFDIPNDEVKSTGCGISVPGDRPECIADAVNEFASMDCSARERMGALGQKAVLAKHDYRVLANEFLSVIEHCAHI